jgi:hypothetical protein
LACVAPIILAISRATLGFSAIQTIIGNYWESEDTENVKEEKMMLISREKIAYLQ